MKTSTIALILVLAFTVQANSLSKVPHTIEDPKTGFTTAAKVTSYQSKCFGRVTRFDFPIGSPTAGLTDGYWVKYAIACMRNTPVMTLRDRKGQPNPVALGKTKPSESDIVPATGFFWTWNYHAARALQVAYSLNPKNPHIQEILDAVKAKRVPPSFAKEGKNEMKALNHMEYFLQPRGMNKLFQFKGTEYEPLYFAAALLLYEAKGTSMFLKGGKGNPKYWNMVYFMQLERNKPGKGQTWWDTLITQGARSKIPLPGKYDNPLVLAKRDPQKREIVAEIQKP